MPFSKHALRLSPGSLLTALSCTLLMGLAQPSQAEFQGGTAQPASALSGINFVQSDAAALQNKHDDINRQLATTQEQLRTTSPTSKTYTALSVKVSQLAATSAALKSILEQLASGKTVSRYDTVQDATGAATITLTYSDGSTTVANIPGNPPKPRDSSNDRDRYGDRYDDRDRYGNRYDDRDRYGNRYDDRYGGGSGGGFGGGFGGGSGGGNSNPLGDILNAIMPQVMGNITNVATGMLGNMAGAVPPPPPVATPYDPTPESDDCLPEPESDATTKQKEGEGNPDTKAATPPTSTAKPDATAATDAEAAKKPTCRQAETDTPNPTSKGVGPGRITSLEEALAAQGRFYCDPANSNCNSNKQQCASLTKYFAPDVGRASGWRKGDMVKGNTNLAIGTPIATFNFGNSYCDTSRGGCGVPGGGVTHTAIYLGQDASGIRVLDQYSGRKATVRTIPWNGNRISGNYYYTIRTSGSGWLHTVPLLQPVEVALKLVPQGAGLLHIPHNSVLF